MKPEISENELEQMTSTRKVDSLLECLLFLSKYYNRPSSAESLTTGLAIYNQFMSPKMFEESALRIGLKIKTVKRELKELSSLALPSVY